jgi:diguanylate cyclase (GGDEF)-like protein/PAS domain S-box-containing protein
MQEDISAATAPPPRRFRVPVAVALALALAAVGLAWVAHHLYGQKARAVMHDAHRGLAAIAALKSSQVENWVGERISDATALGSIHQLAVPLRRFLAEPDAEREREALLRALRSFKQAYGYEDLCLVDANGSVRLSTSRGTRAPSPVALEAARLAMRTRRPEIRGLAAAAPGAPAAFTVAAPLVAGLGPADAVPGVVLLRVDPQRFLFPAVQSWPGQWRSAEALLAREQAGGLVYLSPSRPRAGVISARHGVRGTDWLVVAQVDASEVLEPWRREALVIALAVLLGSLGAAFASGYWRRSRQLRLIERGRAAEQARARLDRLYGALSALNELVARAVSPRELLQGACEIAVSSGDFTSATVRELDLREGSPQDESTTHRLPLFRRGRCVGTLVLQSDARRALDSETEQLLERMASNLSFGLDALAADEELRRFRLALDHSADMVVLVDRATLCFVDVNDTVCRLLGYRRDELVGRRAAELVPVTEDELARDYDELIADPSRTGALRSYYRCKDGTQLPFESTRRALREGDRWLIAAISRDTRERDAAEQNQRRRDAFFRSLIENASDLFGVVDRAWRYTYASGGVLRVLGYRPEEIVGRRFLDSALADDAEPARAALAELETRRRSQATVRLRVRRKDGALRVLEVVIVPGADESGAAAYILTGRDMTDRVRAEDALAASEQRFRSLIEHGADAIVVYDRAMQVSYRSPSAARVTGYADEERVGRGFHDIVLAQDLPAVRSSIDAALRQPGRPQPLRCRYRHKDGSERWLEGALNNLLDAPAVAGMVVNFRDVTDRVRAEYELERREEALRVVAQTSPDGIVRFDRELRCMFVNEAIVKSMGRPREWFVGRSVHDQESQAFASILDPALRAVLGSGETRTVEYGYDTPRGRRLYQARLAPERNPAGEVVSVVAISRDITQQRLAEDRIRESEERLRRIVEATPAPLLLVTESGEVVFANPAAGHVLGRDPAGLSGEPLGLPLTDGRAADVELALPSGELRSAEIRFARTELGGRALLVVSLHDLSERKRYEAQIEHLATHDGLTGLPNRALLRDRVEQAVVHARRSRGSAALMFVDLDQFKLVNDSWGHLIGDALLLEVGRRLSRAVREGDTVARLGGDEFVLLLSDLGAAGDAAVVARKIAAALEEPLRIEGRDLRVSASIGISVYPGDGDDLDSLLQCADAAMYRAKEAGRNGYQYYSAEMSAAARVRVETEAGLRQALERGELRLHYQPQVGLATGEIRGFEALLRWVHPAKGMVSPASFIPVAEDSGLIVPIGEWALGEACRQAQSWSAAGLGRLKVAVNLSARQFWRSSVTEAVRRALGESGLPAEQLEVEITESVVARDLEQVMLTLEQLRRMGVTVAIDDFGTGYSSLAYLRALPIQKLKIDKSFIQNIPADAEASALAAEIVRLAHALSLQVVAEGVETAEQAAFLRAAGCEAMQGFLFARPAPGDECAALLRSGRRFTLPSDAAR